MFFRRAVFLLGCALILSGCNEHDFWAHTGLYDPETSEIKIIACSRKTGGTATSPLLAIAVRNYTYRPKRHFLKNIPMPSPLYPRAESAIYLVAPEARSATKIGTYGTFFPILHWQGDVLWVMPSWSNCLNRIAKASPCRVYRHEAGNVREYVDSNDLPAALMKRAEKVKRSLSSKGRHDQDMGTFACTDGALLAKGKALAEADSSGALVIR